MEVPPNATEEKDYLRKEFAVRLRRGHVEYTVQIQLCEVTQNSEIERDMYNSSTDWPEADHPWMDLMNITLISQLPHDVISVYCIIPKRS